MRNNLILSAAGLKNIVINSQGKEDKFTFIFGEKKIELKSLFAEFISPIVSYLHQSDPTINSIDFQEIINNNQKHNFLNDRSFSKIIQISQGSSITINGDEVSEKEIQELIFLSILLGNEELYSKLNQKVKKTKLEELQELELFYKTSKIFPLISLSTIIDNFASKVTTDDEEQLKKLPRSILYSIINSSQFQFEDSDKLFDIINEVFSKYDDKDKNEDKYEYDDYDESNHIIYFYEKLDLTKLSFKKFNEFLTKIDYREITGTLWHNICQYFSINQQNDKYKEEKYKEEVYEFNGEFTI